MSMFSEVWLQLESWACASPALGRLPWNVPSFALWNLGQMWYKIGCFIAKNPGCVCIYNYNDNDNNNNNIYI